MALPTTPKQCDIKIKSLKKTSDCYGTKEKETYCYYKENSNEEKGCQEESS